MYILRGSPFIFLKVPCDPYNLAATFSISVYPTLERQKGSSTVCSLLYNHTTPICQNTYQSIVSPCDITTNQFYKRVIYLARAVNSETTHQINPIICGRLLLVIDLHSWIVFLLFWHNRDIVKQSTVSYAYFNLLHARYVLSSAICWDLFIHYCFIIFN